MKTKIYSMLLTTLLLMSAVGLRAQEERNQGIIQSYLRGWEYSLKAGFSIGGTSPLPLPEEIRSINSFRPGGVAIAIEGNSTKWFDKEKKWGLTIGLRLESKKMSTDARVKNYSMEIIGNGGERMKGNWTGMVKTKFNASYFTVPILAAWKANQRTRVHFGPYVSLLTRGDFSGYLFAYSLAISDVPSVEQSSNIQI